MNETRSNSAPLWFYIVSALFLIWNLFGLAIFVLAITTFQNRSALEQAGLNEQQVELTLATPSWVNIAFGVAVSFGVLGCIALLFKRKIAVFLFVISLIGVIAQNVYIFFLSDTLAVTGAGASPAVIAGAIVLVPFAIYCANRKWLI